MSGQNNQYPNQGQQPSLTMGMAIGNNEQLYEIHQWSKGQTAQIQAQQAQVREGLNYGGPASSTSQSGGNSGSSGSSGSSAPAYTYYPTNSQGQ